jgi:hypothetical protein
VRRALLAVGLAALLLTAACSSPPANRDPTGALFPAVEGRALDGTAVQLPADLAGAPAVLLVGYVMEAQFDIDRWLIGLAQLQTPVRCLELPTIEGMVPGLFSGTIDEGMRSGIPVEDWGAVVTLYGDEAAPVVELTGRQGPRNGRVFLLDGSGRVVWFHDRGFSASILMQVDARARELASTP